MAAPTSPQSNTVSAKFVEGDEYSDFIISCHGREFKLHSVIMSPQSHNIAKALEINMRESRTGVIKIEQFDADTMECAIKFAYDKKYEVVRRSQGLIFEDAQNEEASHEELESLSISGAQEAEGVVLDSDNNTVASNDEHPATLSHIAKWVTHARVCALADYLLMPELCAYALARFKAVANELPTWDNAVGFIDVIRAVNSVTQEGNTHS